LSACRCQLLVLFSCVILLGCGGSASEDISGKVTFQDAPVTVGHITFSRASSGSTAMGTLGEDGVFTLPASQSALLAPGEYKVTITPVSVHDPTGDSLKDGIKLVEKGGESIPMRYRNRNKTPLRKTIPSDSYDFDMLP